jgi:hypothetical protein
VIVVQCKTGRLGMHLMGKAYFSMYLIERHGPAPFSRSRCARSGMRCSPPSSNPFRTERSLSWEMTHKRKRLRSVNRIRLLPVEIRFRCSECGGVLEV